MAKREILKAIENGGIGYEFYNEGDLHICGGGTVWIDRKAGKFYELRSMNSDLSVDDLTDEEINDIKEQEL